MKIKNILSLIILVTILCGFNSCEDKPLDYESEVDYLLCNDSGWYDEYIDNEGYRCEQILTFYLSGRGEETFIRYYGFGEFDKSHSTFHWYWDDQYDNSIIMDYSDGSRSYFDDLRISSWRLSGILDDTDVVFEPF